MQKKQKKTIAKINKADSNFEILKKNIIHVNGLPRWRLAGYSPQGRKESDMAEVTWQQLTHIYIQLNHFASHLKHCKWGAVLGCSFMSDPWQSHGQAPPGKDTGLSCHALLQGIFPTQGQNPGLPLQMDSLPSEPPRKPKNTALGSLSLLQGIIPSQESNWGLLHCRQILYELS